MLRYFSTAIVSVCTVFMLGSCVTSRRLDYFSKDVRIDTAILRQPVERHDDAMIKANDILAISIASVSFSPEERPSQAFLDGGLTYAVGSGGASGKNSYLVDSSGYIDFPRVGRIKMAGLSIPDAKAQMSSLLVKYIKEPVVEVRIINYRITMLGEVGTPGQILAPNHNITIIDALAASGGIPYSGRKDNVLIIREHEGFREFGRINLNNRNLFSSPYYHLQQNDIVYVYATNIRRQEANEFFRLYLPIFSTLLSSAAAIFAVVSIVNK